ncbi:hypothetical protein CMV_010608 [Castanea mollissima]|uniref:Uncharacterized protein n=1 Tax=Castanea mollissima TaxID=60419 RepID=A0A8J4R6P5_9ROSI|nr:hypothetical protein CMV_010608 [Castanea mollissima]
MPQSHIKLDKPFKFESLTYMDFSSCQEIEMLPDLKLLIQFGEKLGLPQDIACLGARSNISMDPQSSSGLSLQIDLPSFLGSSEFIVFKNVYFKSENLHVNSDGEDTRCEYEIIVPGNKDAHVLKIPTTTMKESNLDTIKFQRELCTNGSDHFFAKPDVALYGKDIGAGDWSLQEANLEFSFSFKGLRLSRREFYWLDPVKEDKKKREKKDKHLCSWQSHRITTSWPLNSTRPKANKLFPPYFHPFQGDLKIAWHVCFS